MTTSTANSSAVAHDQSRLIIPQLASFYEYTPGPSWLIIRLTAGGMLLVHGIMKAMPMVEVGLAATLEAFAANIPARRGIEPALPLAYVAFFLETIGAVCVMLGPFTRFFASALAIQFAIITFVAHWPAGFAAGRGGWEYPLFWGLIMFAIALRGGGPYSVDRRLRWEL